MYKYWLLAHYVTLEIPVKVTSNLNFQQCSSLNLAWGTISYVRFSRQNLILHACLALNNGMRHWSLLQIFSELLESIYLI